jgi:hypothetical protein
MAIKTNEIRLKEGGTLMWEKAAGKFTVRLYTKGDTIQFGLTTPLLAEVLLYAYEHLAKWKQ